MRIGFRFFTAETMEKSKKGVRRANHKYIRVFTGNDGKDQYLYPQDMLNPFKLLLSVFAITKEKIESVFTKENIEKDYGVDQNVFAAHVLEYLTAKAKWDKFFSNPTVAHANKKPVNLNKKKGEKTPNEKAKKTEEKKEDNGKVTINRSLMRKVWAVFNPVKAADADVMYDSKSQSSVISAAEKIKDYIGRKTSIDKKTGITTMKWPDGREIKQDKKGNIIFDSANIPDSDTPVEETPVINTPENNEDLTIGESEAEKHKNRSDAMLGNDNAKKDFVDVPKAADIYTLFKDDKFNSWKISVKNGDYRDNKDRIIYVNNQAEGEKILKHLYKNSLEALQKKGLTAESVTNNINYDVLIADAQNDLEKLKQKAKDLKEQREKHYQEVYKPLSQKTDEISAAQSEIREQVEELKKQYKRLRLENKKAEIQNRINELTRKLDNEKAKTDAAYKEWREAFDKDGEIDREIRHVEDYLIKQQNIVINFLNKAKETKGIAVKDLTDQDKLIKFYNMLISTRESGYNNLLRASAEDFTVGEKLYYVNPYALTVQEVVVKEIDSKGGAYGNDKGITFVNKIGNGQRYDKTFMDYDMICSNLIRADGSMIGKPYDRTEEGISLPVLNNDQYQEHLNRSIAMLGNQNAAGEHDVDSNENIEDTGNEPIADTSNTPPQTDEEMKEEQAETEKAREDAGLPPVGLNYGDRVSTLEDTISLNPNSENYAYKDTGYIAGSQKEKIQDFWKRKKESGEGVSIEEIDWNSLEENPRYAEQQITKANILGDVDYLKFKEKGMSSTAAFLASKVFAAIPKEPVGHTVEARKNYVIAINTLKDRISDCKTVADVYELTKDIKGESDQTYTSQVARDPNVLAINNKRAQYQNEQTKLRSEILDWANGELKQKYMALGKKERKALWRYKDEIRADIDNKIREKYPDYEGNTYFEFQNDRWMGSFINIERPKILQKELNQSYEELKEARAKAKNEIMLTSVTAEVWKQLGEKFTDLMYSNSFQTHKEKLLAYEKDRVTTYPNGSTGDSFSWKYRDKEYDKYESWDWIDTKSKREKKPESEIIEGRVKRRFEMIVPDTIERVGGRDITVKSTEELKKAFNFRDIQTGTYVQTDPASAKWHVDNLAAGFADLCDVLGIPDNQISLNGRLALAVGARGHGKALAHYEPVERVINITKMKGGGSLGHEWFHSFDNMLVEAMNGGNYSVYLTEPNTQSKNVRLVDAFKPNAYHDPIPEEATTQKVKKAFDNLVKAMLDGDTPETEIINYTAKDVEEGKLLFEKNKNYYSYYGGFFGDLSKCTNLNDAIKVINAKYKNSVDLIRAKSGELDKLGKYERKRLKDTVNNYEKYRRAAVAYFDDKADKSEGGEGTVLTGRIVSRFFEDAKALDGDSSKRYWSTPLEMAARAFEAYLCDKLKAMGRKNDYLSGHANNEEYKGMFYPYPTERDRAKINTAFDELFNVIRSENAIRKAMDFEMINKAVRNVLNNTFGVDEIADQKEDEMFIKAFEYCDLYLNRDYKRGDLRHWKGKTFIMNKNGNWERYYD